MTIPYIIKNWYRIASDQEKAIPSSKFVQAGFLDDIPSDLPEITDSEEWMDIIRDTNPPDTQCLVKETSSCKTIYDVGGVEVVLSIVVGGEPLLSFTDHSFGVKFPIKDTRWSQPWDKHNMVYPHQDKTNVQGPTYDVLPEGRLTLKKFVEENVPKKILRDRRFEQIPYFQIQSRKKDQSTRSFVEIFADFRSNFIPEVSGNTNKLHLFHPWWTRFLNFIQSIKEKEAYSNSGSQGYELLTENEFALLLELLREGEALGAFRRNASSDGRWYKKATDEDPTKTLLSYICRHKISARQIIPEDLLSLRGEIASKAQTILNEWKQDKDGFDEMYGSGGPCDEISNDISGILSSAGYDTSEGGQEGDDHAYVIASKDGKSFVVDIPPSIYESGAGYSWKKKEGVVLTPDDVFIAEVDFQEGE